jgi:uncharacterized membrane-anchored protein
MSENNFKSSNNSRIWQFNRQINLSTLVQLVLLAGLILGSWVNLQRQLDILQHDVAAVLQCQKEFQQKVERLSERSISYEYRIRELEKVLAEGREYE